MAATKWTATANRDRLIGSAKAISDGLIATTPALAPYEAALTTALFNYAVIVGNHVASWQDAVEPLTAAEAVSSKPGANAPSESALERVMNLGRVVHLQNEHDLPQTVPD